MKVVVGLGNPGPEYVNTPHNVGFAVVEQLAAANEGRFRTQNRFRAEVARVTLMGEPVLLVKPMTYMNNSGEATGAILRYNKVDVSDLILVFDDADLPLGRLRVRAGGGAGGHRGVASVLQHVSGSAFSRVRLGIGRRGTSGLVGHVLSPFGTERREVADEMVGQAAEAVSCIISDGVQRAMNRFNAAPKSSEESSGREDE